MKPLAIKPVNYVAQNDCVIIEGTSRGMASTTGREFQINWVLVCNLLNGKITRLCHYYDTADLANALAGAGVLRKAA